MKNKVHSTTEAQPMASLSNSSWQTRKEHPNRSSNNGDMIDNAKQDDVSDCVIE